jgi:hypothetical protein
MKTITKLSYAFFMCASLAMVSCSGDDDGGSTNGGNTSGEYVKAKIDGSSWSSSSTIDVVSASNPTESVLMVQGSNNSGEVIQISLMSYDGEGTYDVSSQISGYAQYGTISPIAFYNSAVGGGATGEVTITEVTDTFVKGTFEFTGRNTEEGSTETVNVTNGEFKANFQQR